MVNLRHYLCLIAFVLALPLHAQSSDNGDGTFTNPVIWTDMPDPDVVQVGDTFYMVTTSMHMMPGVTLVSSTDLVNWQFAANVVPRIDDDPLFDLMGGNRYARGQWATALRHWGGRFHVLFTSNSGGTFIYSSPTMQGPWQRTTLYAGPWSPYNDRYTPLYEQDHGDGASHHVLYDPGFLVDNDGRVYVVHGNSVNYITELDPQTLQAKAPARVLYHAHRTGLEGNRPYHIGDYYYVICTYGGSQTGNVTCLRSRSLDGPWEEREVMCQGARWGHHHILQACLIPLASGQTWAMAFADMGELGRIPHLVPVHWLDGWPVFGDWAEGTLTLRKPLVRAGQTEPDARPAQPTLATSDDFSSPQLGLQWQFNHNPDPRHYSLTERPGHLRLHALRAPQAVPRGVAYQLPSQYVGGGEDMLRSSIEVSTSAPLLMARNTITQRLFGPYSCATARVDVSHLRMGDCAGLAVLNIPYATLSISRTSRGLTLSQVTGDNQREQHHASVGLLSVQAHELWLRAEVDGIAGTATFSYSFDGDRFQPLGPTFTMHYDGTYFVGNRFALFCYSNTRNRGGYIDIDSFDVQVSPLFRRHVASGTELQAEWTDALWRTECRWSAAPDGSIRNQDVAFTADGGLVAFRSLAVEGDLRRIGFTLRNVSTRRTFIELKDADTGLVLATADLPEPSASYSTLWAPLSQPLVSGHRLELRIWGHDWDTPWQGEVLVDKIQFE